MSKMYSAQYMLWIWRVIKALANHSNDHNLQAYREILTWGQPKLCRKILTRKLLKKTTNFSHTTAQFWHCSCQKMPK